MEENPETPTQIVVVDPARPDQADPSAPRTGPTSPAEDEETPQDSATPVDLKPEYIRWAVQYGMEVAAWKDQDHYYRASPEELDAVVPVITKQLNRLPEKSKAWIANAGAVLEWQPLVNFFWRRGLHWYRVHVRHTERKWGPDGPLPLDTDQGGGNPREHHGTAANDGMG